MRPDIARKLAIRVAYEHAELRPHILKAIKAASGGKTAAPWTGNLPKGWTQDSVKKFWDTLTGDVKHKVTKCMKEMEGKVDDTGAFCGSLADKATGDTSWRGKKASSGRDLFEGLVDYSGLVSVYRTLSKVDRQAADLLRDVMDQLTEELELSRGAQEALNRVRTIASRGQSWDPALLRNNIFKAANLLGMKLPSGMFASEQKTAADAVDAKFWVEPQAVKNMTVKEYEDDNYGTSHRSGIFVLKGVLKVQPKGYIWTMDTPFSIRVELAEHGPSGTIVFQAVQKAGLDHMVVTAIGKSYKTEDAVLAMLGKVPFVYYDDRRG